ncbi:ATP-binding cassette domain-containing protein [Hydrogenivirga sp. 128-5-R1-1]|uniref:ATP-binding cassette domain-containing protein n=1 Tax=Hydrogenivirga sp. 128-5-R1-1 TaxID=392423 RepID=UPI00015F3362|nr:ATP-binding cassette domain-containing protein [Hydrogenivirga sp. 128-5-R1-1]EDP74874.1 ABC transporter, ATP-binding protein [Hydrogenivirga sp. 128-5-R1-1]
MLELKNFTLKVGAMRLYVGNMEVRSGEFILLTGDNGTGKTSLLSAVAGLHKDYEGSIIFNNSDVTSLYTYQRARLGIRYMLQNANIVNTLSVEEYVFLVTHREKKKVNTVLEILDVFGIKNLSQKCEDLSYGQKKLLSISSCLLPDTKLLLLDEPFAGISFDNKQLLVSMLLNFKQQGGSAIIVEHQVDTIQELSDKHFSFLVKDLGYVNLIQGGAVNVA